MNGQATEINLAPTVDPSFNLRISPSSALKVRRICQVLAFPHLDRMFGMDLTLFWCIRDRDNYLNEGSF